MKTDLQEIRQTLLDLLQAHVPPLQVRVDSPENTEFAGTRPVMQGKQKVDGHYFASIMPKPKDVRLYFFPVYTHAADYPTLSADLQKALKGKSCFHIRRLSPEMEAELQEMIARGVALYQEAELL